MDHIAVFKIEYEKKNERQRWGGSGDFLYLGWRHHILIYNLSHPAVEAHLKH